MMAEKASSTHAHTYSYCSYRHLHKTHTKPTATTNNATMTVAATANGHNEIPPTVPSGIPRMKKFMFIGLMALTVGYGSLVYVLQDSASFLTPAQHHCAQQDEVCSRPDLFAFQIVPGLAMLWVAVAGFFTWHVSKRVHTALPATPEGRLFGYLKESEQLAAASLAFQIWDFFISLSIKEHRGTNVSGILFLLVECRRLSPVSNITRLFRKNARTSFTSCRSQLFLSRISGKTPMLMTI